MSAEDALQKIQQQFHQVILSRAGNLIEKNNVALPELKLAKGDYFPVPGMYGGFHYWFEGEGDHLKLMTRSWSRIADGFGQLHEVTADGYKLVAEEHCWLEPNEPGDNAKVFTKQVVWRDVEE